MLSSLPVPRATSIRLDIALRECRHIPWSPSTPLTEHNRYFCNPNFKSHIEVLPGTYRTEEEKKYPGVNSGQYLVQRLATTY